MSCFDVKILDPNINTIEVETCIGDQPSSIDIVTYNNTNILEISHCIALLPSEINDLITVKDILAGSGINIVTNSGIYTISLSDSNLTSSDITDFNSAVSGLIPPSNFTSLSGISGITVSNSGTNYIVSLTDSTIQLADITDLSNNGRTFLLTPSSNNLSSLVNDETGSGLLVFNNSPTFSGVPTVPTAPSGTNTDQIASTSFVRSEISNLIDSAPITLDTLNELAAALGDDPNFATTITNALGGKANLSGAVFTGPVSIPSGAGNFNSLTVNGTGVSLSGHSHISSNITDFSYSVSGLLPSVTGVGQATSTFANNIYTISVSGLQPSGNYSVVGHSHIIADVSGLQNVLDSKQPSGIYASGVHYHISSDITDFNSSVSGLLPGVTGSGYVLSLFDNNIYTLSVTGLQPSGNYSLAGHPHLSSDITDFNSSVSGLLPVKDIVAGSGISIGSVSGTYTVTAFGVAASSASSLITEVYNNTASTIPKGSVVYINGGHGNLPTISLAIANGESGSSKTYGITQTNISSNNNGNVIVIGSLIDFNTNQFGAVEGTTLYLSPSVSGGITTTKPLAPNHLVSVGKIVRNHNIQGVIEVSIQNGFELGELHNVFTNGTSDGQFLRYNLGSGLWIPSSSGNFSSLTVNNTGVSVSGHTHTLITQHSLASDLNALASNGINYTYIFNNGSEEYSLVLPTAVNNQSIYSLKNNTNGTVYIKTSNSETVDNYTPTPSPSGTVIGLNIKYSSITLISDNSGWLIV